MSVTKMKFIFSFIQFFFFFLHILSKRDKKSFFFFNFDKTFQVIINEFVPVIRWLGIFVSCYKVFSVFFNFFFFVNNY